MTRRVYSSVERQIPAYQVNINTSAFQYKKSSYQQKMQNEHIPEYWEKFRMDQKRIIPSSQDRLSELTTGQIDRIIDMEKIRSLLYDKKRKMEDIYFQYDDQNPDMHANVYQANFLAKINAIAIKRDIHKESHEGMDEYVLQKHNKNHDKQKKGAIMPFKYAKQYKNNAPSRQVKTSYTQEDDIKSIESFQDNLQDFEQKLIQRKKFSELSNKKNKVRKQEYKLLPSKRWFYGMSFYYLNKCKPEKVPAKKQIWRSNYDIEYEMSLPNQTKKRSFNQLKIDSKNTTQSTFRKGQALLKYKTNRLVTLK